MEKTPKLRMGMVGGGQGSFIGAVHRTAACLDGEVELVAGALSSSPERSLASGKELGLADRRNYATYHEMIEGELALPADQRIDFASIVTPNDTHYEVAKAFASAGFNIVCDKPLVHTSKQAEELVSIVEKSGIVFAVTYNYSGYPMIKQARHMVEQGDLGVIRKVVVEYNQGWLATKLETTGQKQAEWRTDPARAGLGGAIGDIGSHAEHLASYVTQLETEAICADLTSFVDGRQLDDDANLLLRYRGGARGVLIASQICVGGENDLRLRVWGTKGGIAWHQEDPNFLRFHPNGNPEKIYRRGNDYLCEAAKTSSRLPSGHPEAFIEAFANIYCAAGSAIRNRVAGNPEPHPSYPNIYDGARGVRFIEQTIESSKNEAKWTKSGPGVHESD